MAHSPSTPPACAAAKASKSDTDASALRSGPCKPLEHARQVRRGPVSVQPLTVQRVRKRKRQVLPEDRLEIRLPHGCNVLERQLEAGGNPFRSRGRDGERARRRGNRGALFLRLRRLRTGNGRARIGPGRDARHFHAKARQDRVGEDGRSDRVEIDANRSRRRRHVAPLALLRRLRNVEQLNRDRAGGRAGGNALRPCRRLQLGFRPGRKTAPPGRHQEARQGRLAAKLDPLPHFRVRLPVARLRLLFGFLLLDGNRRGAQLAFQVRRPGLDSVELTSLFVGKRIGKAQFGHLLPLAGLALAKLLQFPLCRSHWRPPKCALVGIRPDHYRLSPSAPRLSGIRRFVQQFPDHGIPGALLRCPLAPIFLRRLGDMARAAKRLQIVVRPRITAPVERLDVIAL